MAFAVGDSVWFKRVGQTPYVRGSGESDDGAVSGASLGGRGKAAVSKSATAGSGLSDAQGVPTIQFADFPGAIVSGHDKDAGDDLDGAVTNTEDGAQHLGVRDQITDGHPLAPRTVATDGVFDGPTDAALFNPAKDDGDTTPGTDTIEDIDPNYPSGRSAAARAGGASSPVGNVNPYGGGRVNLKAGTVGVRLPSSQESAGSVIQVVTVGSAGVSVDGTKVRAGDKMYWVNWGTNNPSNPHRTKLNNKMRATLHAEADLVAAY